MSLLLNDLDQIRKEIIEVYLISLKARFEMAKGHAEFDPNDGESHLLSHQIEALEKELEDVKGRLNE